VHLDKKLLHKFITTLHTFVDIIEIAGLYNGVAMYYGIEPLCCRRYIDNNYMDWHSDQ